MTRGKSWVSAPRITVPLETALGEFPSVESIRCASSVGLAFVYVTFDWKTDTYRAADGDRTPLEA